MPTIISHPFVAFAFYPAFRKYQFEPFIYLAGAVCSILPDLDVIGFQFGIRYGDLLGHRGLSHSIAFALVVSVLVTTVLVHREQKSGRFATFLFLFLCTLSHGILDAFTDGGLGVAFFSPFSNTRYFFPWTPLKVSPIGIFSFLSGPALSVLASEIKFVWVPCVLLFFLGRLITRHRHHL